MEDDYWSEQAWDTRYREQEQRFSGDPNPALLAEVAGLAVGSAIDVGAGEGADAVWLAEHGWQTTAADLSTVALDRAEATAAAAGVTITLLHNDIVCDPVPGRYDLVAASYVHVPGDARRMLFTRLAEAVAPGGTLLIVGHDPADLAILRPDDPDDPHDPGDPGDPGERHRLAEAMWTAEQVAAVLDDGWVIDTCASRPRRHVHRGEERTVRDAILRAHRTG